MPVALAVLAAVLVGVYIVSYRNSVNSGAGLVKVLVATRDIPAGTDRLDRRHRRLPEDARPCPAARSSPARSSSAAPLTSLVATDPIYKGEQVTLRQFGPIAQAGIFAKFSGKQRAVAVLGDPTQLLAGTLSDGDHVDVVATVQYTSGGVSRATTRVDPAEPARARQRRTAKAISVSSGEKTPATLVMTDRQAQTMGWAMKNSTWFLALRPTANPRTARRASRR